MRVQLRYFASIREALGRREEIVDVPEGSTVASIWEQLIARHPPLQQQRYRPAVNQEYVTPAATLHDGDELVFIPPVSGGAAFWICDFGFWINAAEKGKNYACCKP